LLLLLLVRRAAASAQEREVLPVRVMVLLVLLEATHGGGQRVRQAELFEQRGELLVPFLFRLAHLLQAAAML
jgi:hypothetical protein